MTDVNDDDLPDDFDQSPEEAFEWFRREVRQRGLRIAYNALKTVCEDPKAAAPAKATAGVALLRAAGALAQKDDGGHEKADHEKTAQELNAEIERLETRRRELARGSGRQASRRQRGNLVDDTGVFS